MICELVRKSFVFLRQGFETVLHSPILHVPVFLAILNRFAQANSTTLVIGSRTWVLIGDSGCSRLTAPLLEVGELLPDSVT